MWLTAFVSFMVATVAASVLTPPVLPLIVRNPYLSTWLSNAREPPWKHWPMFWNGQPLGFSVMAFVPGAKTVYPLLGRPHDSLPKAESFAVSMPAYGGASFDASTTNLTYTLEDTSAAAGSINITLSFLSPITPTSTLRQSIPASYMICYVDGPVDVSIYVDVNGGWVSKRKDTKITWSFHQTPANGQASSDIKSWSVARETQLLFTEDDDRAEWGSLRFTGPSEANHQAGPAAASRIQFAETGRLLDETDENFRAIGDNEPVFAFSKSFPGRNGSEVATPGTVFTFALVQDPVIQFAAARGLTYMRPFWASYIPQSDDMITFHYADYMAASSLARNYSNRLVADALTSASQGYLDIVALSARQVLGATQFSGTPDKPVIFLKEISSDGNLQTVDVIYPAFPFFLYTNPQWLAYLLEPLLEHQLSGQYPNNYSMHDIGYHFPNGTGHAGGHDEYMPVEECGNMLIMALALANSNADDSHQDLTVQSLSFLDSSAGTIVGKNGARQWVSRSYRLWKQWTGYLVREALIPRNQLSTDDFAGWLANQTNLALKGIIGIRAMSELSKLVEEHEDAQFYRETADSYMSKWQEYGLSRDGSHAKLAYTWYGSWTTIYNLYSDALLCFHLRDNKAVALSGEQTPLTGKGQTPFIPNEIYQMQSRWYRAVLQRYGLPLDSRHLYTKSDWEIFAAAVASKGTRDAIIESISRWVNETVTDRPLTDLYDTEGKGNFSPTRFMARPVAGGHFALLALKEACGGEAMNGLAFLDEEDTVGIDVAAALAADTDLEGTWWSPEL